MDFSAAKIRCSAIYNIMGGYNSKTYLQQYEEVAQEIAAQQLRRDNMKKKDGPGYQKIVESIARWETVLQALEAVKNDDLPLSPGAKTYATSIYADIKYGKWNPTKDIGNKYTSKGKVAEEAAINMVSTLEGEIFVKNDLFVENDYLTGTPDIIVGDNPYRAEKIIDVKSPWDCETFFSNLTGGLNPLYDFQMQGYMAITNAPVAEVHFCLVNIPDFMWEDERRKLFKRMEVVTEEAPEFKKAELQLWKNLNFDDMSINERRIKFIVPRDEEKIQKIYNQVGKVRLYLQEIENLHILKT